MDDARYERPFIGTLSGEVAQLLLPVGQPTEVASEGAFVSEAGDAVRARLEFGYRDGRHYTTPSLCHSR